MIAVDIPSKWRHATVTKGNRPYSMRHVALIDDEKTRKFMEDIVQPVSRLDGDSIPISKVRKPPFKLLLGLMINQLTSIVTLHLSSF